MKAVLLVLLPLALGGPVRLSLFRTTTTCRTYRLRWPAGAPKFRDGWTDEIFQVGLRVGQPVQHVNLTLDYGWGPTFLFGDGRRPCRQPKRLKRKTCVRRKAPRKFFHSKRSRSFFSTDLNYGFTLESPFVGDCGKYPIAGELVEDTIKIGRTTVKGVPFVLTPRKDVEGILHPHWPADGILGLAYWNGFFGDTTYSFILKLLSKLPEKSVTVFMNNKSGHLGSTHKGGEMVIGGKDDRNCRPDWRYVTASWTYGWSVVIDSFSFGNSARWGRSGVGVLASPSSLIYAPKDVFEAILRETGAQYDVRADLFFVDCGRRASLPDLVFQLQGFEYRVPARFYARDLGIHAADGKRCALLLGESSRDDSWFLGTTFNRPHCLLFDFTTGNMKMAFAALQH
ncbi:Peptidase A1 domain-containing protein [Aphelenchoides fujianensis]|nr:Peptidase A1 domain-containing protein [Aphelenchoides fujianensis]